MRVGGHWVAIAVLAWGTGSAIRLCNADESPRRTASSPAPATRDLTSGPIAPLTPYPGLDPAEVALGERLFHDPRLSRDGSMSCATCHDIASGGDDGRPVSLGVDGVAGTRNAPSVLTAALSFRQFWDGRAETLEEQAAAPVVHPDEMGADWDTVVARLESDTDYVRRFEQVYGTSINEENACRAIASFERSLLPLDSPFDRFLRGEGDLEPKALRGYELFQQLGCIACHQGRGIGGNLFQRFGIFGNYFDDRGDSSEQDQGRVLVTGAEADRFVFKVPSLRNVAETAPYLHDGSIETLAEVVRIMGRYQLDLELREDDVLDIVAFLQSLTGAPRR